MLPSPQHPQRRPTRLPGFDYAADGAYFVTLVSNHRRCVFGAAGNRPTPSAIGRIVEEEWRRTPSIRREIELGPYVLMPNHLHALVIISTEQSDQAGLSDASETGSTPRGPGKRSLSALIGGLKSATTRRCRAHRLLAPVEPLWQRGFYEHIVRNEHDWNAIEQYIADNPARWLEDRERPLDVEWPPCTITPEPRV